MGDRSGRRGPRLEDDFVYPPIGLVLLCRSSRDDGIETVERLHWAIWETGARPHGTTRAHRPNPSCPSKSAAQSVSHTEGKRVCEGWIITDGSYFSMVNGRKTESKL